MFMRTEYLKRVLPFTLTFIIGAGLGGFTSLFKTKNTHSYSYMTTRDVGRGCSSRSRRWSGRYSMQGADGAQARMSVVATQSFPADNRMFEQGRKWEPVRLLRTPEPLYTYSARRNGTQGVVRFSVIFGADGKAKVEHVVSTLPDGLTEEATDAVRRIEFSPATLGGEPVSTHGVVDCAFELLAGKRL
jgi:hypothetical protein